MCIDQDLNIYTTATELTLANIGETFLFKFDKNGTFLKKFRTEYSGVRDMVLYENKIILARGNLHFQIKN